MPLDYQFQILPDIINLIDTQLPKLTWAELQDNHKSIFNTYFYPKFATQGKFFDSVFGIYLEVKRAIDEKDYTTKDCVLYKKFVAEDRETLQPLFIAYCHYCLQSEDEVTEEILKTLNTLISWSDALCGSWLTPEEEVLKFLTYNVGRELIQQAQQNDNMKASSLTLVVSLKKLYTGKSTAAIDDVALWLEQPYTLYHENDLSQSTPKITAILEQLKNKVAKVQKAKTTSKPRALLYWLIQKPTEAIGKTAKSEVDKGLELGTTNKVSR